MSSDALFIDVVRSVLRPGGRAGVVMPSSLLANPRWRELRDRIDGSFVRRAVCALPEGVFRPFGGAGGRAALLWLERRGPSPDAAPPCQWASLADPGYDPRSIALKPTSMEEVDRLAAGVGWEPLAVGRWTPRRPHLAGVTIGSLCRLRAERAPSGADGWRVDLADVDRVRGECHPVKDRPTSARQRVVAGDVLVARLRPELGNVAVAYGERLLGSPEWLVLADCPAPHLLATLLRTEAWRTHLPTTGGQTRPRTTADAVLGSRVPWPADEQRDALEAGIAGLYAARADIAERLARIEAAAAEYVETGDVEAFAAVVHGAAVEGVGRPG